ncbi:uncharacterized protein LOC142628902 [Castanea sativa]|uniref:uncharacterized protein LOC142628902 n=1 Tax=Castanea sativa TaxID=21020 RepID=UPI003F651E34
MALLGPLGLYNKTQNRPQPKPIASDPFMDLMVKNFNNTVNYKPKKGYTENNSATFLSSGNPCLDFFFHVVPDTPAESLIQRLELAWTHNPLTTLKLIYNLRGVRGTGKSDKEGFYTAAFWLHKDHPKTLACNIGSLSDFGYMKDLPEILYRLLEGSDVRKNQRDEWKKRKSGKKSSSSLSRGVQTYLRMVDDLLKKGKLKNCLAICDVSGSMEGVPMEVSVALGVLVSELGEEPWKRKLITFSKNPKLYLIRGNDLVSKTSFVRRMEWGMNTDFQKVFDLILEVAVNGKLKEDQMVKRLFVFSDTEFDKASRYKWETDYEAIQRKFRKKGYGSAIPEIVFWNLRDSSATPVPGTQNGVALVSGYSKNLMNLFLDNDGAMNPELIMEAAISGEEYQKLFVLD